MVIKRVIAVFFVALAVRAALIALTPNMTRSLDICMYSSVGELVSAGVDPYDFSDRPDIRSALRSKVCDKWFSATQERWDYYVSSNLPLTQLMFGGINRLFPASRIALRVMFALVDALLAVLVFEFLLRVWKIESTRANLLLALGLCALSPTLLWWDTVIPEDKGVQIFLMIAALFAARKHFLVTSALFLGASIAFKGLGVFIAPLCLWYIVQNRSGERGFDARALQRGLTFFGISLLVVVICFAPFMPEIIHMMRYRLSTNLSAAEPSHGSIWRPVYYIVGSWWSPVKTALIALFVAMHVYLVVKGRLSAEVATASALILFVDVSLLGGSMDRMNIGLMVALLLVGIADVGAGVRLGWYYLVGGALATVGTVAILKLGIAPEGEVMDGIFVFGFVLLFSYQVWRAGRWDRVRVRSG